MKRLIIITTLIAMAFGCTDETTAKRVLEENGYTEIQLTGYDGFCCAKDDMYSTTFTAKNPFGKIVKGCVCNSGRKGATIRFE